MRSIFLSLKFTTSDHMASFQYPLQLDLTKVNKASLLSMETYNTLFNITEKNKFSYNPGTVYSMKTILSGANYISQISSEIVYLMKKQSDDPINITIGVQKHTSKSSIQLKKQLQS